ncbi:hypothetical protein BHM03_00059886 [Ensete ventricosum]|nr:hypothetical protein BHM03_00059886 [Ensete ventricosum]
MLTKVRRTGPYLRTEIWPVRYGSVTVDFDRYRVCSSYRPAQGGPRTGKPSDRYIPPIPGGTENLADKYLTTCIIVQGIKNQYMLAISINTPWFDPILLYWQRASKRRLASLNLQAMRFKEAPLGRLPKPKRPTLQASAWVKLGDRPGF